MNKVLIDRELLERAVYGLELAYETDTPAVRDICAVLAAPSGTPAMPVKAYYHEAPNEYGGLNKSVGLEVRKAFIDAPLVLESDAMECITYLEGEIAKRDEELAACRVAVENCELFRARIAELEAQYQRDVYGLNNEGDPIGGDPAGGYANDNARLRTELAAIKAQGVVMPERWNVPRPMWKDVRQPYGNPLNHADIEAAEKFNLALDEVARLNAAPVQQVSVPDDFVCDSKPLQELLNATAMLLEAPCQDSATYWAAQLANVEQLLAAPAAPAADAPPESCRQRLAAEGKPYPRSSCAACGQFSPKWRECDAAISAHRANGVPSAKS